MTGKHNDYDSNRAKYHGKRRNATTTFNSNSRSADDDCNFFILFFLFTLINNLINFFQTIKRGRV